MKRFTLIEFLIIVSVIAIIAGLCLPFLEKMKKLRNQQVQEQIGTTLYVVELQGADGSVVSYDCYKCVKTDYSVVLYDDYDKFIVEIILRKDDRVMIRPIRK